MSRAPTLPHTLIPKASVSGIVDKDGTRVVQGSRRPDGTFRKELKIRPGFTPEEDVTRYRTTRAAEADARAAVKGRVVGLAPSAVQAAVSGMGMSKAQKKNLKRKEKKREDGAEEVESSDEEGGEKAKEVADDWDSEGEEAPVAKKEPTPPPPPPPAPAPVIEESKRVKALKKKLRQAESLRERETLGLYLPPAEREKIKTIPSLEEELAKMTLGDAEGEAAAPEDK
ncbi:partner of Y14 and mago, partial [Phenoliferia sp. Uapishka_3]